MFNRIKQVKFFRKLLYIIKFLNVLIICSNNLFSYFNPSCDQMWSFKRQIGKRLDLMNNDKNLDVQYYAEKLISNVTSREACQSACLKYSVSNQENNRNGQNRYQFNSHFSLQFNKQKESKESNFVCRSLNFNTKTGSCILLSYNQYSTYGKPIKLETDKSNYEYIENSCVQGKLFCFLFEF